MLEPDNIEELGKSIVKTIDELDAENRRLHDERANLLDIEAKLQARVNEEVAARKQENAELKLEVETLKQRCEKLTQYLNKQRTAEID